MARAGMMRLAWAAAAAYVLSGCGAMDRAVPQSLRPAPPAAVPASELVAYLVRLRGLNERGLAAEAARQKDKAREAPGDLAQLKVAIALSLSSQGEEGEILALVEPVIRRNGADDDLKAMAGFLQVQAVERRRLKEIAATAGARLRDERRASEALRLRADAVQERAAQLQQKLDALTELEKSLSDRQAQGH